MKTTFTIEHEGQKFYRTSETRTYTHAVVVTNTANPGVIGWCGSVELAAKLASSKRNKPFWKGAVFTVVPAVATQGSAPKDAKSTGGNATNAARRAAVRSVVVSCVDCGAAGETRGHQTCAYPSSTEGA